MANARVITTAIIAALILYTAEYWAFLHRYMLARPFFDDYEIFLPTLKSAADEGSIFKKLAVLWSQHNEHRPLVPRLVAIAVLSTSGCLSFVTLQIVANVLVVASAALVCFSFLSIARETRFYLGVPLFVLLLSPAIYGCALWATAGLQFFGALFFSVLAGLLLEKRLTFVKYVGVAFAMFASQGCLASGNFCWVVAVILLIRANRKQEAAALIPASLLSYCLYLYDYVSPQSSRFAVDFAGVKRIVVYFFAGIGSGISSSTEQAALCGLLIFLLLAIVFVAQKSREVSCLDFVFSLVVVNICCRVFCPSKSGDRLYSVASKIFAARVVSDRDYVLEVDQSSDGSVSTSYLHSSSRGVRYLVR